MVNLVTQKTYLIEPKQFIKDRERVYHRQTLINYLDGKGIDPFIQEIWYEPRWEVHEWTERISKGSLKNERDSIFSKYRKLVDQDETIDIAEEIRKLQYERDLDQAELDRDRAKLEITKEELDMAKNELEQLKVIHKEKWEELEREKKRKKQLKIGGGAIAVLAAGYFLTKDSL